MKFIITVNFYGNKDNSKLWINKLEIIMSEELILLMEIKPLKDE